MQETLRSEDFSNCLNEKFRIQAENIEPFEVELINVTELGMEPGSEMESEKRRPFSVVFRGFQGASLPQHIYEVAHEKLGELDLFLVPLGPDEVGMRYEAVFT